MVRPEPGRPRAAAAGARIRPDSGRDAMSRRALITGAAGQDGWYLARLLLERGYEVHGHARSAAQAEAGSPIVRHYGDIGDAAEVSRLLAGVRPDEIYNLASFSRPRDAIEQPVASSVVNALGPLHIFDFARQHLPACRIFQPSSSEIFGAAASRPLMTTVAPASASACAMAKPSPREAPVTSATRPSSEKSPARPGIDSSVISKKQHRRGRACPDRLDYRDPTGRSRMT